MNLASRLRAIAEEKNPAIRSEKAVLFEKEVCKHAEKNLLLACLEGAKEGRKAISLGKKTVPPQSLTSEGFKLKVQNVGYLYSFE